ncbi:CapA family protein [Luteolibacter yonseiensis]|uniref:CapA family protein n=1 Tax=Luteolibacter yonseiensis TaxID=1144680 RepID=A0A934QZ15_9BACT|nr:CapA family protein [Luteolibacter yonseiensis]MBK1815328.1 CapA family protein [Luteolibacter yonseiensis]
MLIAVLAGFVRAGQELPVFIADNHAETAGWIIRNFDLDEKHVLVLVDAHSDGSAAERSEEIREQLRRVPSEKERAARVEDWRKTGRIQAFNWIEPLMPRPLDRVLWLAAPELSAKERAAKTLDATESLDGRLEVEPRSAGSFERRWETCDLKRYRDWQPGTRKVVLAIDLDFFAGMNPADRVSRFEEIWERAMDWPGLAGVAFAVSRPWLGGDEEADALVSLAVDAVRRTRGAFLELDASLDDRPDDSSKAAELKHQVPRWDIAKISAGLRMKLGMMADDLRIADRNRRWSAAAWADESVSARIVPDHGEIDCDGVWRFPLGGEPVLRAEASAASTGRTRWFLLEPARDAYDLLPETGLGKDFSQSPARWIYEKRRSLGESGDSQLDPAAWRRPTGGRFFVEAEMETTEGWIPTPRIELRIRSAEGFRGAVSECFGMPYVFGIAGVRAGDLSGVETGWGGDCANLFVHAWRRNGIPLAWGDPGRLRARLATKAEGVSLQDPVKITPEEIARGVVVDFGKHVAAVWEDREPFGLLDGGDAVVHHLGGFPEIVALSRLAESRPVFSLRVPAALPTCRLAFAGDVVLAGEERRVIDGFGKGGADRFVANLEGIPSMREPDTKPRYDFRFPPERLAWLKERGVDAVSLANNHAADAGRDGIVEGMKALDAAGISYFGVGKNEAEACRPWRVTARGVRLAVFGASYFPAGAAGADHPGIAVLPSHQDRIAREIQEARTAGERVIIMVHGGDEYDVKVNDEQRRWARWLVARGASFIVGAHPHVVQRGENHGGAVVFHSLGNAVYPADLKGADSGRIQVLEVGAATGLEKQ